MASDLPPTPTRPKTGVGQQPSPPSIPREKLEDAMHAQSDRRIASITDTSPTSKRQGSPPFKESQYTDVPDPSSTSDMAATDAGLHRADEVKDEDAQQSTAATLGHSQTQLVLSKAGPWWTLMKETVELRDKVFEKRVGIEMKVANYNAQWQHTSAHLLNFLSTATELMELLPEHIPQTTHDALQERWARLQKSASHLQKWQNQGIAELDALTGWEGALAIKEEQLYSELKLMVSGPEMSIPDESDSGETLEYDRLSDTTSERTHPLVHEYHDKVGDLHIIREHIFNADADHQRREIQREQALMNGDLVGDKKDRQAYETYVESRADIIKEFFETKKEMEKLRLQCQKRGLTVEDFELAPFLDLSGCIDRPATQHATRALRISGRWNPDIYLMFGGLDKQNRILLWRDKVRRALGEEANQSRSSSKARNTPLPLPSPPVNPFPLPEGLPLPPPPPPPFPAFPVPIFPEQAVDDDPDADVDEGAFRFEGFQEDSPPERRYSEPNLFEALRQKTRPTTQFLLEEETSKSESGLEALKRATEKTSAQSQGWLWPMSRSAKQKFRPRGR